jgi:hypothetical protein
VSAARIARVVDVGIFSKKLYSLLGNKLWSKRWTVLVIFREAAASRLMRSFR